MVEIAEGRGGQLEGTEADVVQGLVVNAEALIGVLDELMHGKSSVVRLDDGVGNLRGRNDGEGQHDAIGVLLTDLGDEQGSHTGTSATAERVSDLEALKAISRLSLLAHDVENRVDQLGALSVVTFGPVVASTGLAENEVVRTEDLAIRTGANGIHSARLQIHENSAGNITTTSGLIVIDVDALELKVGITMVGTGGIHTCTMMSQYCSAE
mmetsp:Transcript_76585/g.206366  ORF Transcript_76585/g.206366 Transcript_76585/m.206366 type:complete len:211 (+) Transcript_76585:793-1425(+)